MKIISDSPLKHQKSMHCHPHLLTNENRSILCLIRCTSQKMEIDCFIGLAKAILLNFISHYFQKHVDGTESNRIHYLIIQAKVTKRTSKYT